MSLNNFAKHISKYPKAKLVKLCVMYAEELMELKDGQSTKVKRA